MMQRRIGSMLGAMALVAGCAPAPVTPPPDTGVTTDSAVATDGSMMMGEGGTCNEFGAIVTPSRNMDMGCEGFQAAPCNAAETEFCPRFRNNEPMRRKFVLTQIDIQTPASLLSTQPVGRLLNTSIRNAAFSWGVDLDLGMMRIRTGTIRQPVNRVFGTGYFAQDMQFVMGGAPGMGGGDRWNPVTAPITNVGGLLGMPMNMTVPLITIPVYDEMDRSMLLTELPLRDARIGDLRLTANGNCIGTAKPNFDSCAANTTRWNTSSGDAPMVTPYGVLEAKLTFEDTLNVQVVSLNMPLCNIIARSPCRDATTMMPVNPMSLTIPPDTTVNVGGMMKPAWTLRAFIAGAAVNITN